MNRLAFLTVPLAAVLAWIGILEMLAPDRWLGSITVVAALYVLCFPALCSSEQEPEALSDDGNPF